MLWFEIISGQTFENILFKCRNASGLMALHSALLRPGVGRYSFICKDPFARFEAQQDSYLWNGEMIQPSCPWSFIQEQLHRYNNPKHPTLPPFQGGAIGYFGYEFTQNFNLQDNINVPSCVLNFYENVLAFDHSTQTLYLIATGFPEQTPTKRELRARRALAEMKKSIESDPIDFVDSKKSMGSDSIDCSLVGPMTSNFTAEAYVQAVDEVRTRILNGDIFQANLTQQFQAPLIHPVDYFEWYQQLSRGNPAPFSALMQLNETAWMLSASPERFISLMDGEVMAEPIKGTRKRAPNEEIDRLLREELASSDKDRAENIMIVDLMRNDLSRVCLPGSIEVSQLCGLHSFETVHHLISTVKGRLVSEYSALDLLKATFPPGSVTGAPKIKAMEVISEMEKTARGPYCGCFGYLSFSGDLDMAVTIRTYVTNKDHVYFGAGGGIVLGSDAEAEYEESLTKARRLKDILLGTNKSWF